MKINSNIGGNFEPQDFQKSGIGETPASNPFQSDQLEAFYSSFGILQNADFSSRGPEVQDANFGAGLLFGVRNESFGLQFAPAPEAPAPAADDDSFSLRDMFPPFSGWIADAADWLGDNIPNTPEAMEWLGGKVVDGFLIAGEAVGDAAKAVYDGFNAAGEAVGDAMGSIENAVSDAFDW